MRINIMKEDEKFAGIFDNRIALQNSRGEVRIVSLIEDDGIRIDTEHEIVIGYGNNEVTYGNIDDSVEITTF